MEIDFADNIETDKSGKNIFATKINHQISHNSFPLPQKLDYNI